MSATFASLRLVNYRLWFFGAFVSNTGGWMQRVAQDWLVLTVLTDESGFAVGVVTALQFLPGLVLSPWAGLLADRLDRRRLLVATQVGQAVLACALGALVLLGHVELWNVYVFALLFGCVVAIDGPVRQVFVNDLVPGRHLPNAVALNSASFHAARLVGPAMAGLMILWVGTGWVFVVNGLSYVAPLIALAAMRRSEMTPATRVARTTGQIRAALAYVRGRGDIVVILIVIGVISMFGLNFQLTTALMARTEFAKGPGEYGLLGSAIAIGALGGSLLAARRKRPRVRLVVGAAFAFGLASGVLALMPSYLTFAIACIPAGFAALTMMTAANATVQTTTSPAMRGRVMALYLMVFMGVTPIGSPIVGWVGETFGARWSIGLGSISALLVSIGTATWVFRRWNLDVAYQWHRPFIRISAPEQPV